MTASNPMILKTIIFTLGGTSFAEDVINLAVVPTPPDVKTVTTLDGVVHQDVGPVGWALEGECIIDWSTSTRVGLAYYLFSNKGTSVAFVFDNDTTAESATAPKLTGTCRIVPVQFGGDGNEYATATFSLPITGDPTVDVTP